MSEINTTDDGLALWTSNLEAAQQASKERRLAELRKAVYERELNIAVFTAKGETGRVEQEQAEIDDLKTAIDALVALDA